MGLAGRWNPWRALRARTHVELRWADLPEWTGGGLWQPLGDGTAVITIDAGLSRRDRSAVLAHELIHDERGIGYTVTTPAGLVEKEEAVVHTIVAERLVPLDELEVFVVRCTGAGDPVTLASVADEFDVPPDVAAKAVHLLQLRRQARRHPIWRG